MCEEKKISQARRNGNDEYFFLLFVTKYVRIKTGGIIKLVCCSAWV